MLMLPDHAGIVARSHRPEYSQMHLGWKCSNCDVYLPGGDRDGMMPPPTPTEDQCPQFKVPAEWEIPASWQLLSGHPPTNVVR